MKLPKKEDLEFLAPDSQVKKIEQIDSTLLREIKENAIQEYLGNINLSSLFVQTEPESGLKAFLPYIITIVSIVTLIVIIAK